MFKDSRPSNVRDLQGLNKANALSLFKKCYSIISENINVRGATKTYRFSFAFQVLFASYKESQIVFR